jgi:ZIP family zinc transporter
MESQSVLIAFGLTLFAGLSTGIGSALAFFAKRTNTKLLTIALGFSAGVMIYVSFVEIFPKARECLTGELGEFAGFGVTVMAFFAGIICVGIIDKLIPSFENPHEVHKVEEMSNTLQIARFQKLYRMGLLAALAIGIHNFPEGFATFASALKDIKIGVPIAIAIAIHNIPEGIAVSIPIFYATGNKNKAFMYSFLSGLSEPIGALIGYILLFSFFNDIVFGILFASVAGIMVFISLDELLPTAREYGEHHLAVYGLVAGMAVMAVSLLMFL